MRCGDLIRGLGKAERCRNNQFGGLLAQQPGYRPTRLLDETRRIALSIDREDLDRRPAVVTQQGAHSLESDRQIGRAHV